MSNFELPPQRLVRLKLTPGIPEGQEIFLGGQINMAIMPGEIISVEANLAQKMVSSVYGMEYADNLPAPVVEPEPEPSLEEKLSKRKGNCKTC